MNQLYHDLEVNSPETVMLSWAGTIRIGKGESYLYLESKILEMLSVRAA